MAGTSPEASTVVVIAGMPRSGTQLMRRLLGSHSLIAVPTKEFKVHDVVLGQVDVAGFLDRLPLREWGVDATDLVHRPIDQVYPELLRRCADVVGKPVAGEKSPGNEHCYEDMLEWFDGQRLVVVHMVRDPVERLASLSKAPFRRHMEVDVDPHRQGRLWCASVRRAVERTAASPGTYRMVRYEELASDPETIARGLFELIGVPHEPEALDLWAYESPDNTSFPDPDRSSQPAIRLPPSRSSVLSAEDIAATIAATGDLARSVGYDLAVVSG